jgi:hypothetical protein
MHDVLDTMILADYHGQSAHPWAVEAVCAKDGVALLSSPSGNVLLRRVAIAFTGGYH